MCISIYYGQSEDGRDDDDDDDDVCECEWVEWVEWSLWRVNDRVSLGMDDERVSEFELMGGW